MANRAKQKGTACESALVDYLRGRGHPAAERRALAGGADKGDILIPTLPWLAIEVKNHRSPRYQQWLREADAAAGNAGAEVGIVVHKPMGVGLARPDDWHVVMTLKMFMRLVDREMQA